MGYRLEDVEGIGTAYRERLLTAGIKTTDDLLVRCATAKGRQGICEKTGLGHALVLNWTNKADLMRVKGVGPQYSELLEAAGVDTVKELRHRAPEHLAVKMREVNRERRLCQRPPNAPVIERWVTHAKGLSPRVRH